MNAPKRHLRKNSRRGAAIIELGLSLPVIMALLLGVLDYGWYFFQQSAALNAVKDACRVGVSVGEGQDPAARAEQVALQIVEDTGLGRPGDMKVTGVVETLGGARALRVTLDMPFVPLAGLVPAPSRIRSSRVMLLERQMDGYYADNS